MTLSRWKIALPVVLASTLALAACGGGSETAAGGGGGGTKTLRLGHIFPESSPVHTAATTFASDVSTRTGGSVKVTVFPGGALGGDAEAGQSLIRGELDCAMLNHPAAGMDPRLQLGFLPYVVSSYEAADKIFYGEGMIAANDRKVLEEIGVHALAFYENDFRGLTNNKRTVTSPQDLSGLKIRVPELPAYVNLFKAWGAQPLPIAFPELYTALQQGTVDGQDNGIVLTFDSKFQEVQKYFTRTNHAYGTGVLACSKKVYDTLTPEQKTQLTEAAEAAAKAQVQANRAGVQERLDGLKAAGVEVTELTPAQVDAFRAVRDDVWNAYSGTFGADFLAQLRKAADEAEGA